MRPGSSAQCAHPIPRGARSVIKESLRAASPLTLRRDGSWSSLEQVMTAMSWDESYTGEQPPPWDIGRPQPVFVRLAEQGLLSGRVLDAGCGTGEHVLLAAEHGATDPTGIDLSPTAIEAARAKAAQRGISAR